MRSARLPTVHQAEMPQSNLRGTSLVTCFFHVPILADNMDHACLRALAQTSRGLRQIADQPLLWKNLFARHIGADPRSLPSAQTSIELSAEQIGQNIGVAPPFKIIYQGLAVLQYRAENPGKKIQGHVYKTVAARAAKNYFNTHLKTLMLNCSARTAEVKRHGKEVAKFLSMIAAGVALIIIVGAVTATQLQDVAQLDVSRGAPKATVVARLVAIAGVQGAKAVLSTVFGLLTAAGIGVVVGSGCILVELLTLLRGENNLHQLIMEDYKKRAPIDAGREVNERNIAMELV